MKNTYLVIKGELILRSDKAIRKEYRIMLVLFFGRFLCRMVATALVFCVTWFVFKLYIEIPTLETTISLGAVFATLGSSLVSAMSLICGEHYSRFSENTRILQGELAGDSIWEHWPFVRRINKYSKNKKAKEYQKLRNPSVIFQIGKATCEIPIPASKADFSDLPICRKYIFLKRKRPLYRHELALSNDKETTKDILIWDCLTEIYRSIIIYKLGNWLIWIGGCFVFASIVFSFCYIYIAWML